MTNPLLRSNRNHGMSWRAHSSSEPVGQAFSAHVRLRYSQTESTRLHVSMLLKHHGARLVAWGRSEGGLGLSGSLRRVRSTLY